MRLFGVRSVRIVRRSSCSPTGLARALSAPSNRAACRISSIPILPAAARILTVGGPEADPHRDGILNHQNRPHGLGAGLRGLSSPCEDLSYDRQ